MVLLSPARVLGAAHRPSHLQLWPVHAEAGVGGGGSLEGIAQVPLSSGAPQCHQGAARGHRLRHLGPAVGWPSSVTIVLGMVEHSHTLLPTPNHTRQWPGCSWAPASPSPAR